MGLLPTDQKVVKGVIRFENIIPFIEPRISHTPSRQGKNNRQEQQTTMGGAINMVSKRPSEKFEAVTGLGVGLGGQRPGRTQGKRTTEGFRPARQGAVDVRTPGRLSIGLGRRPRIRHGGHASKLRGPGPGDGERALAQGLGRRFFSWLSLRQNLLP